MKVILGIGVMLFKTPNGGIAFYCVLQMIGFSLLFAYVVVTLRAFGAKRWFCILTLLFFAAEPNIMYRSQVVEKDSTFSFFVLLFTLTLWRMIVYSRCGKSIREQRLDAIFLAIGALGFCTMRTNGFYTFLPFTIVALFALPKRLRIVKYICSAACALTMTYLLLIPKLGIINPDPVEAISIPIQNVGRVLYDGGSIAAEDRALLERIVTLDGIEEYYTPYTSDSLKMRIREARNQDYLKANAASFLALWFRIGLHNPRLYLYSWIDETCGYWTPQYVSPRVHYNDTSDMKDYIVGNPWGYYADPILPDNGIRIVQSWMVNAKKIPVIAMFRNIGTATWLAVAALGAVVIRKSAMAFCCMCHTSCSF